MHLFLMSKSQRELYINNNYEYFVVNKLLKPRIPGHLVPISNKLIVYLKCV